MVSGTDVNATDAKGVTPLHLALSRLRMLGGKETAEEGGGSERGGEGGNGVPSFRKKEIMHVSSLAHQGYFGPLHVDDSLLTVPCIAAKILRLGIFVPAIYIKRLKETLLTIGRS